MLESENGQEKMTSFDKEEQRTVIKLCVSLKKSRTETNDLLKSATGKPSVCRSLVYMWFSDGRGSNKDNQRGGRPKVLDDAILTSVEEIMREDRRVSLREIKERLGVSLGTVHNAMKRLRMNKVCARWVPRLLKPEDNLSRRVDCSRNFLGRYRREGDNFNNKIITTDETMINLYDPETKRELSDWKRSSSPPPVKARVVKSAAKVMFIFFLDRYGMLLIHPVPEGQTVNAEYYSKVLRRHLVRTIQKKRTGRDVESLIFHQDNAPPHTARSTIMDIEFNIGFERLNHAPYSPDLAPCDFDFFFRY